MSPVTRGDSSEGHLNPGIWSERGSVIGLRDAYLVQATSAGTGSLTQTTAFKSAGDWVTLRSDSARLLLTNSTGGSVTLAEVTIRGKPVTMLSGDEGFIHDGFVDEGSIQKIGERSFEFGNEDVVTKAQLESLADYWWKYLSTAKHIYVCTMSGMRHYMQAGEWYRLTIGGAGEAEYIDATVECYNVRMTRQAGQIGQTVGIFREVEEAWKKDSNVAARFIASGGTSRVYGKKLTVMVGSSTYTGVADVYCDGTADQTEINSLITKMAASGIHGVIQLTAGTYILSAAIEMKSNVTLMGAGIGATIIEKNCNDYAIEAVGTSGSELSGVGIKDLSVTRNASDTNANIPLVFFDYTDDSVIERAFIDDSYYIGVTATDCDRIAVRGCKFASNGGGNEPALGLVDCTYAIISGNELNNDSGVAIQLTASGSEFVCHSTVTGNVINSCGYNGIEVSLCDYVTVTGNTVNDAGGAGIYIATANYATVAGNVVNESTAANIRVLTATYSSITGNSIEGGSADGILVDSDIGCTGNTVGNNAILGCGARGIYINGAFNTVVMGNRASGCTTANYTDSGTGTTDQTAAADSYNDFS